MVIITVDRWAWCSTWSVRGICFFTYLNFEQSGCDKLSLYGVLYIDLHNPSFMSAVKQAMSLAWIPKIIGRNCLLFSFFFSWDVSAGCCSRALSLLKMNWKLMEHLIWFVHGSFKNKRQLPWKYVFCRREELSRYSNRWLYLYRTKTACDALFLYSFMYIQVKLSKSSEQKADGI